MRNKQLPRCVERAAVAANLVDGGADELVGRVRIGRERAGWRLLRLVSLPAALRTVVVVLDGRLGG